MADKDTTTSTPPTDVPPTSDTPAADKPAITSPSTAAGVAPSPPAENPFDDAPGVPAPTTPAAQPVAAAAPTALPASVLPLTSELPAPTPVPASAPAAVPAATEAREPRQTPTDPQVASLHAMFPDFEDLVLQSVLESVGGDQDRAIDTLLGMSDPEYMSDARPAEPVVSRTDLDEQLARRLMLEDEEQHRQAWQAQQAQLQQAIPYEPLQRQSHPLPQQGQGPPLPGQQGQAGEKDAMAEFQEQFSKVAEAGKKTFGSIFSKVKAKMQEFDQPRPTQGSSSSQPAWGAPSSPPHSGTQQRYEPYAGQQQQQQPAYYDPNPQISPPGSAGHPVVQGYDVTPTPNPAQPRLSPTAAAAAPPPVSPIATASSETPRPPATGAGQGTPIDGGKLGLLPKRPVSLLRSQSPPAAAGAQPQRKPTDEEELEYTENPFEDGRK